MKNNIVLAFGSDKNYLNKEHFQNYLNSIQKNSNFDRNVLCYLGTDELTLEYNKIEIFNIDLACIVKPNSNNCIQHGEFLNSESFNNVKDSDIIIFTDGDMTLQRGLSEQEDLFLRNLKDNDVYVLYNKHSDNPAFNLIEEALHFQEDLDCNWVSNFNEDLSKIKCYNTGILCMNKKTWIKLKDLYIKKFDLINRLFKHYAKQQWLISYILETKGFNIYIMGNEFHVANIYSPSNAVYIEDGIVKSKNSIALFKHEPAHGGYPWLEKQLT